MTGLPSPLQRLLHGEQGATMVEYAFMAAFIAAVVFTAVQALGIGVFEIFADPALDLP